MEQHGLCQAGGLSSRCSSVKPPRSDWAVLALKQNIYPGGFNSVYPRGSLVFLAAFKLSKLARASLPSFAPAWFFCHLLNSLPPSSLTYTSAHLKPPTPPSFKHNSWGSSELLPTVRNKPVTTCNGTPVFAASHGRKRSQFCCQELQRAAEPPCRAGHYLDFPAGRMDTGSVCTSASDVLLEPCGTGEAPLETSLSVSGWSGQGLSLRLLLPDISHPFTVIS